MSVIAQCPCHVYLITQVQGCICILCSLSAPLPSSLLCLQEFQNNQCSQHQRRAHWCDSTNGHMTFLVKFLAHSDTLGQHVPNRKLCLFTAPSSCLVSVVPACLLLAKAFLKTGHSFSVLFELPPPPFLSSHDIIMASFSYLFDHAPLSTLLPGSVAPDKQLFSDS